MRLHSTFLSKVCRPQLSNVQTSLLRNTNICLCNHGLANTEVGVHTSGVDIVTLHSILETAHMVVEIRNDGDLKKLRFILVSFKMIQLPILYRTMTMMSIIVKYSTSICSASAWCAAAGGRRWRGGRGRGPGWRRGCSRHPGTRSGTPSPGQGCGN